MIKILWRIGRLNPGEYWIEDAPAGVQVGWVNRDENDGNWYVLDSDHKRRAGPFRTLREARAVVEDALRNEFGVGGPAN
jgi:hypothetical protein